MIYKTKIINNIKYDLIESDYSSTCDNCDFIGCDAINNQVCLLDDEDHDCFIYGRNALWKIKLSYSRKIKLDKLNSL